MWDVEGESEERFSLVGSSSSYYRCERCGVRHTACRLPAPQKKKKAAAAVDEGVGDVEQGRAGEPVAPGLVEAEAAAPAPAKRKTKKKKVVTHEAGEEGT